ncbi:MAG: hypothetical protein N3A54_02215 [Patescibacteria group bacterium]|nr:hypothetical protein [Patescibacteria group bacterium]
MKLREEYSPIPEPDDAEFTAWLNKQDQEIEREGKDLILSDMVHRLFKDKVELMKLYGNFDEAKYHEEVALVVDYLKEVKKKTGKYLLFGTYQKKMDDIFDVKEKTTGTITSHVEIKTKSNKAVENDIKEKFRDELKEALQGSKRVSSLIQRAKNHVDTNLLITDVFDIFMVEAILVYYTYYDTQFIMLDLEKNDVNTLKDFVLFLPDKKTKTPKSILVPEKNVFMSPIQFVYNDIFKVGDVMKIVSTIRPVVEEYFEYVLQNKIINKEEVVETPGFMLILLVGMISFITYWISEQIGKRDVHRDTSLLILDTEQMGINFTNLYYEYTEKFSNQYENNTIATFGRVFSGIILNK